VTRRTQSGNYCFFSEDIYAGASTFMQLKRKKHTNLWGNSQLLTCPPQPC
jgi:hypothetical protein